MGPAASVVSGVLGASSATVVATRGVWSLRRPRYIADAAFVTVDAGDDTGDGGNCKVEVVTEGWSAFNKLDRRGEVTGLDSGNEPSDLVVLFKCCARFFKVEVAVKLDGDVLGDCLLYTSPSPRDLSTSRMPSSA